MLDFMLIVNPPLPDFAMMFSIIRSMLGDEINSHGQCLSLTAALP